MNEALKELENKLKEFKKGEDYKIEATSEKQTYTAFNKELRELFIYFVSRFTEESAKEMKKNLDKDISLVKFWAEEGKSFIQIGETAEEKKQREEEEKQRHEDNTEQEKQLEQWRKEGSKCHMCGKKTSLISVSFKDRQGKLITGCCSPECWEKFEDGSPEREFAKKLRQNIQDSAAKINQSQTNQQLVLSPSPEPKLQPTESQPKNNYLPWIIGGTVFFLAVIGIIFLLLKKQKGKKNQE